MRILIVRTNREHWRQHVRRATRRRGATLVLLAICLPVALILAAFAVNLSYIELCRTEMYTATDAATRAGTREFMFTNNQAKGMAMAREAASRNTVAGSPLKFNDHDFVFGASSRLAENQRYSFTSGGSNLNALQVTGRRTKNGPNGPISLLMPNLLGINQVEMQQSTRSTQVEVDISLVVDRSGSMTYAADETANGGSPPAAAPDGWEYGDPVTFESRWRDLVDGVEVFTNELERSVLSERVALVTYSDEAKIEQQFTQNYSLVEEALDAHTQSFAGGRTNIGEGIRMGAEAFNADADRPWASKVIVVMTDGKWNRGPNPVDVAAEAADKKLMIYTITFANEADQTVMQEVAGTGLGQHYHATSAAELSTAFRAIVRSLPVLLTK